MEDVMQRRRPYPRGSGGRGKKRRRTAITWRRFLRWAYMHVRRLAHTVHGLTADNPAAGPVSFLAVSAALGLALTITTLYTASYTVTVDGEDIGVVDSQSVVTSAIAQVERQGTRLLGYDYKIDSNVDYQFALTLKTQLSDRKTIENYFYQQLDKVSAQLCKYQVTLNGQAVGALKSKARVELLLDEIKDQYRTENTVSVEFMDNVQIENVYTEDVLVTEAQLRQALTANTTGETTYTVVKGDTFSAIAYANDMSISDLLALNPGWDINRLMIGDVLNVKQIIPLLSVKTVDNMTYTQPIECPVETVEDSSMYKGNSKIVTQGEKGELEVNANVTYVNGYETEREILSSTTLREPTTTVKAIGTKERPKTASTGSYSWPIRGRINSYFGGRYIFGRYSYHSGIDIQASYGAAITAADGGTVTFSGYKGSYGNLVILTHDNGTQTYYGHNSSLVVSAGQKVYKGQTIAKAGSTGRSTGTHCHFEIRVGGTAVNPLNYLR